MQDLPITRLTPLFQLELEWKKSKRWKRRKEKKEEKRKRRKKKKKKTEKEKKKKRITCRSLEKKEKLLRRGSLDPNAYFFVRIFFSKIVRKFICAYPMILTFLLEGLKWKSSPAFDSQLLKRHNPAIQRWSQFAIWTLSHAT